MRDLASCFSDYAVNISDTSCSSYSATSCVSPALDLLPSLQNSVTCLYRAILPSSSITNHVFITLTWCKTVNSSHGFSIALNDESAVLKLTTNSRIFRKMKGGKTVEFHGVVVELSWDLTSARYGSGPEPIDGFFISIAVDSEPCFVIGDSESKKSRLYYSTAGKFSLISREEQHFSDEAVYSTRARFSEEGHPHDIQIRCGGDSDNKKNPVLSVCIDKKLVIRVKRLQWNFRGNQTIFLDGLLVDLLWDVHDWFYNSGSGCSARFMFRTRTRLESRLWLEDKKLVHDKDEEKMEFSLMIHASKNASN